ncbi:hypothetical protein [Phycicoccus flavus]|uniref:hypothetical protein n=1 Tax=Phycicoccus flavus TaxID=2502783 RepID=UPI000FEB7B56|nr:hypothetical protein [Phycicoccus flavus]NHA67338.1 hypothetical protein [Phycicoccus flavus]
MPTIPGPELPPGTVVRRPPTGTVWQFRDRRIEGVTFRGVRTPEEWLSFERTVFVDCTFERCDLQWDWGGDHEHQDDGPHLLGCRIVRCDLRNTSLPYGRIEGSTFDTCRWHSHLDAVDLVDNVFVGVVDSLSLWGRNQPLIPSIRPRSRPNEIRGNDFTAADLRGLGLHAGVPVHDQRWPEGPGCGVVERVPERVAALRARTEGSPDPADQELVDAVTDWEYWDDPGNRQQDAWLRWDDPSMPESSNRFHRALAELDLG